MQLLKYFFALLTSVLILGLCSCERDKDFPNIVFFLVDDLGWSDIVPNNPLSFYETPNLEELSRNGMRFTDAYASCPVCSPTRASIMTGKSPARLHITDWIPGDDPKNRKLIGPPDLHQLPLEEKTIAETLKENGYATCHIGKWHLGGEGFYPEDQGFDINIGGWDKGSPGRAGYYSPYENPKLPDGPEEEFLTDRLTNEAISFIESSKDIPFFLNFDFYTVHTPIQAARDYIDHFNNKKDSLPENPGPAQKPEHDGFTKLVQDNPDYASMVFAMDASVGRVIEKLKQLGIYDKTYIFFTSDNGGLSTLYNRGYPTSNLPLRAGKGWCYEGGIRVPLIITGPGIKGGRTSGRMVTSMDYYPTILDLAGIRQMPRQHVDGTSIFSVLTNHNRADTDSGTRSTLFWFYPHYHGSAWTPGAAIRVGDWKLIEFYDKQKVELYNLDEDIGELNNLADSLPEKANELQDLLREILYECDADMPVNNPEWGEI
jgi:arylsulfatase A-like enzyme